MYISRGFRSKTRLEELFGLVTSPRYEIIVSRDVYPLKILDSTHSIIAHAAVRSGSVH